MNIHGTCNHSRVYIYKYILKEKRNEEKKKMLKLISYTIYSLVLNRSLKHKMMIEM